jgi:thiosulfate/3-mercaptopyruvate sulfurtransferase
MKLLPRLAAFFSMLVVAVAAGAAPPLLAPEELRALLGRPELRVIDIRDPKSYAAGHIPGAVSAPYPSWRGPASNPGELPELPKLTALVQRLGLTPATHAVIVSSGADETDFGAAARVFWTLEVLGLEELSILNGGVAAWARAALPQDTTPAAVAASSYVPVLDSSLLATRGEVRARIGDGRGQLVDARPAEFYLGQTRHQAARVPGTLEGAVNLAHSSWFLPGTATMVPADEARRIAATLPATPAGPGAETISFCNTGHWAATNWFALSKLAGRPNVKLYAGSMVDWTQDPEALPMDHVPGRLQQLWVDARLWMDRNFK